jgi:hypothetical protein
MLRHGEAELEDGGAAVGEQALAESRVDPRPCDDARAVLRDPYVLGKVPQFIDGFRCVHASLVERRLDRIDALLQRRGALDDRIVVRHVHPPGLWSASVFAAAARASTRLPPVAPSGGGSRPLN